MTEFLTIIQNKQKTKQTKPTHTQKNPSLNKYKQIKHANKQHKANKPNHCFNATGIF